MLVLESNDKWNKGMEGQQKKKGEEKGKVNYDILAVIFWCLHNQFLVKVAWFYSGEDILKVNNNRDVRK
jgi:hypothetical protein